MQGEFLYQIDVSVNKQYVLGAGSYIIKIMHKHKYNGGNELEKCKTVRILLQKTEIK